jgi:hypothetical protein
MILGLYELFFQLKDTNAKRYLGNRGMDSTYLDSFFFFEIHVSGFWTHGLAAGKPRPVRSGEVEIIASNRERQQ